MSWWGQIKQKGFRFGYSKYKINLDEFREKICKVSLGAENADCLQLCTILEVERVVAIIFLKNYDQKLFVRKSVIST